MKATDSSRDNANHPHDHAREETTPGAHSIASDCFCWLDSSPPLHEEPGRFLRQEGESGRQGRVGQQECFEEEDGMQQGHAVFRKSWWC